MSGKYTDVVTIQGPIEAQVLEQALRDQDIECRVVSFHDTALDGLYQLHKGWGVIRVPEELREKAEAVIQETRDNLPDADQDGGKPPAREVPAPSQAQLDRLTGELSMALANPGSVPFETGLDKTEIQLCDVNTAQLLGRADLKSVYRRHGLRTLHLKRAELFIARLGFPHSLMLDLWMESRGKPQEASDLSAWYEISAARPDRVLACFGKKPAALLRKLARDYLVLITDTHLEFGPLWKTPDESVADLLATVRVLPDLYQ